MTTAQVVEASVFVISNSLIQNYVHPDDPTNPTYEMTPGFKPFTKNYFPTKENIFYPMPNGEKKSDVGEFKCVK